MKKFGLIGMPLGHSFSARFFAEKFAKEGIDARYDNYEMPDVDGLRALIEGDVELCGLNVTIPHKQTVIPLLDEMSDEARSIGAVNVIKIIRDTQAKEDGNLPKCGIRLKGYNSDVIGFRESIRPLLPLTYSSAVPADACLSKNLSPLTSPLSPLKALVLGTGGASKAVVAGLRQLGVEPTYVSRHPLPGQLSYGDLSEEVMSSHMVIVNCSPVGMHPHVDASPAIPYHLLTPEHILYDLVYNPLDTRFMQLGREQGATVKNGLEMLHLQALAAWQFWNE